MFISQRMHRQFEHLKVSFYFKDWNPPFPSGVGILFGFTGTGFVAYLPETKVVNPMVIKILHAQTVSMTFLTSISFVWIWSVWENNITHFLHVIMYEHCKTRINYMLAPFVSLWKVHHHGSVINFINETNKQNAAMKTRHVHVVSQTITASKEWK